MWKGWEGGGYHVGGLYFIDVLNLIVLVSDIFIDDHVQNIPKILLIMEKLK